MNKNTKPIKVKPNQHNILKHLLKYRFLNRIQIQTLLHHKNHKPILTWLNELVTNGYLKQDYDKKIASTPTVYFLGLESRKYFKNHTDFKNLNLGILNRIWREEKLSQTFRDHCQFVADIYLSLLKLTARTKAKLHFSTKTDLYGMDYMILPSPDAYFAIEETNGAIKRYFLDIFDDVPPGVMRNRVRQYFYYYNKDYWQDHTDKPFPAIILVCPNDRLKNHLTYYIQKKLEQESELNFYLTTWNSIKAKGLVKEVLLKVVEKE